MSVLVGGLIGSEREFRVKAAGFRTIILITVGSTLFTIFSISIDPDHNRTAIAGNIVRASAFWAPGAIIREGGRVGGLTTAATIWLSAALGWGSARASSTSSFPSALAVLVILLLFPRLEQWFHRISEFRTYQIVMDLRSRKESGENSTSSGCLFITHKRNEPEKDREHDCWEMELVGAPKITTNLCRSCCKIMMLKSSSIDQPDHIQKMNCVFPA